MTCAFTGGIGTQHIVLLVDSSACLYVELFILAHIAGVECILTCTAGVECVLTCTAGMECVLTCTAGMEWILTYIHVAGMECY